MRSSSAPATSIERFQPLQVLTAGLVHSGSERRKKPPRPTSAMR